MLGIKTDTGLDELIGYSQVRNAFAVCGHGVNEDFGDVRSVGLGHATHGTDDLSIVLKGLLNELRIADLSTFEALLLHDTGAVLDAIRSTAAAAEAGAAAYASSATSNVVVSPGRTATAGVISV